MCTILLTFICAAVAFAENDITWLMGLYGFDLPDALQKSIYISNAQPYDCGAVEVTIQEILYDGVWLYTSATLMPKDDETTLIIPDSADWGDFVAGGYKENFRNDARTFRNAAAEDGKLLASIMVYPMEYEDADYFFLDHRQDAGSQSTVFSGAPVAWMEQNKIIHLSVHVQMIDPVAGTILSEEHFFHPIKIDMVGPVTKQIYKSEEPELPINSLQLVHTPLTSYALPSWKSSTDAMMYTIHIVDNTGKVINRGAPLDTNTYNMAELPTTVNVLFEGKTDDRIKKIIKLNIAD